MLHLGQFRHTLDAPPLPGKKMVVRTDRGVELAEVVANLGEQDAPFFIHPDRLDEWLEANGDGYPFRRNGRVLRAASPQDLIDFRHLETSAEEERALCRKFIRQLGLEMKLVSVEHLLGGERIVFYFTADHRVDFRELVRRLAAEYRTRIEMRQVGARDEARLVADLERCGQRCCCQQYLKELKPISMRMAKVQKATLDPSKISGRCGRLMCCLRYEDATYADLRRRLPKRKIWVRTESQVGKVLSTQVLTQLVKLQLPDGTTEVVANEQIVERDVPEPEPGQAQARPGRDKPEPTPAEASRPNEKPSEPKPDKSKRRRRRRKSRSGRSSGKSGSGGQSGGGSGKKSSKRRRRRKPRKGGRSSGGDGGGKSGGSGGSGAGSG
jgi:cell fate regulator YaaT (PSP1 superfamily)